jgi:hypothetical protein
MEILVSALVISSCLDWPGRVWTPNRIMSYPINTLFFLILYAMQTYVAYHYHPSSEKLTHLPWSDIQGSEAPKSFSFQGAWAVRKNLGSKTGLA